MSRIFGILMVAILTMISLSGCQKKEKVTILVAAAASLKYSLEEELVLMFEEKYPDITVECTFDSSQKLQTQIEEGLTADVFMSAARKQMTALTEKGYVESQAVCELLENKIVLIVPSGNDQGFTTFEDIVKADMIAIGDPESVPAGQYAKEALISLGLWEKVEQKSSFGTNVTEVLNWVAQKSAQAGVVYETDAKTTKNVELVAFAPQGSLEKPVIYPVAAIKSSEHAEEAALFVDFLQTDEAIAVFEKYGFSRY